MPFINERGSKRESEGICRINDKEKNGYSTTMPHSCFAVDLVRLGDMGIIDIGQCVLSAKSLGSANSRDDFFRNASAVRDMLA